jgi:hypothetical protein
VRQGRTDAWIAHKLDISVGQLEQFKRDHGLVAGAEPPPPDPEPAISAYDPPPVPDEAPSREEPEERDDREPEPEPTRRRRRGRRGGRRRGGRRTTSYEATFDHGEEGYGLWLDPAVADNPIYEKHWAGHRAVAVVVEADAITIRRDEGDGARARQAEGDDEDLGPARDDDYGEADDDEDY